MDHHDHMHHMEMDHGGHGGHMDHGDMDMGKCNMNMLFTWSTKNLCIVFESWRITNTFTLFLSLILIVVLCAGYEAVREMSRRYEASCARQLTNTASTSGVSESSSLLRLGNAVPRSQRRSDIVKAILYAVQVFYSFFIMLLFMTYNGWIMLAVAIGAFVGHLVFGINTSATKSVACH